MDIRALRIGNLIKINPSENQEGILTVAEIHKETLIAEMQSPRKGYLFRVKFEEIIPLPLTDEWLLQAGFILSPDGLLWKDSRNRADFDAKHKQFYINHTIPAPPIAFVHEFQNGYFFLTGKDLENE